MRRWFARFVGVLVMGFGSPADAQVAPDGEEFQINVIAAGEQSGPAAQISGPNEVIIAWNSALRTRVLDLTSLTLGPEVEGAPSTPAALASTGMGHVAFAWIEPTAGGSGTSLFLQRYSPSGSPMGNRVFLLHHPTMVLTDPQLSLTRTGTVAATVWMGDVYAQAFDPCGRQFGPEFRAPLDTSHGHGRGRLALSEWGGVVVWNSYDQDGSNYGVFGRRFAPTGYPVSGEFQINTYTIADQENADVAMAPDGRFVVVWQSMGQDGDWHGIFGQRFAADGSALGGEFQANTHVVDRQQEPAVAINSNGEFIVVWQSALQDGSGTGVFGQYFDAQGARLGPEFQVNTYVTGEQRLPAVALADNGAFLVVWESVGQDGDRGGIFGQVFRPTTISILKRTLGAVKKKFR